MEQLGNKACLVMHRYDEPCSVVWCRRCRIHCYLAAPILLFQCRFKLFQRSDPSACRKEFVVNLDKEGRIPRNTYSPPLKVSPGYFTKMT